MRTPTLPKVLLPVLMLFLHTAIFASPTNDDCSLAIPLDFSGVPLSFDNENATNSPEVQPSCEYYQGGDVWFNVKMPMSGHLSVETLSGTNENPCVALYRGNCSNLIEYDCRYDGSSTNNGCVTIHDENLAGEELFIRVFQYNTIVGGTFQIRAHQPEIPDNDFCQSAVTLNVNSSCSPTLYTNANTTDSPSAIGTTCGYRGADVWFRARVPASGRMVIDAMGIENPDPVIGLFTGDCNNLNEYDCRQKDSPTNDGRIIINNIELANKFVYFNVFRYFKRNGGTFELCAFEPQIPDNDFCNKAIDLNITTSCTPTSYSNVFTTEASQYDDPSCGLFSGGDVWFKFNVPSSGKLSIDLDPGTNELPYMTLYKGACNNFTEYDCGGYGYTGDEKIVVNDQSMAGQKMYLRVFQYYERNGGTFDICLKEPAVPNNDYCGSAIGLAVNGSQCTQYTYTNEYATPSNQADEPECGEYKGGDVWFNFTVPSSGHLVIDAINGTNNDPVLGVYTGSCGSFNLYDCHYGGILEGYSRVMIHDENIAGQKLYLRVFESENESGGTFDLCLYEPDIPNNDFCFDAIHLGTPNAQENTKTYSNLYTTPSANVSAPSCGNYLGGDVWFSVNIPASGHLAIDAIGGTNADPVLTLYRGTCSNFTQYDCQYRGGPNNESRIILHDESLAGQKMYVRAYRYFHREGGTFDIRTYEPEIPDNDFCIDATDLGIISKECVQTTFTNKYTTTTAASPTPSCGVFQGGDVWFKLQMPASGHLAIDAFSGTNIDPTMSIYTGSCGNFIEYDCRDNGSPTDDGRITIHDENLAEQTLYIRTYQYYSKNGGTFDLCLFEPDIPDNDFCEKAIDLEVNNTCGMRFHTNDFATDSPQAPPTCGLYRGGDVWFKAQVPASGRLVIDTDENTIQPVIGIYRGACGDIVNYDCNSGNSMNDNGGKVYINDPTLSNEMVYIRIFQFYNRNGGDFGMCVFEPVIPTNQECSNATVLAVGSSPDYQLFSNEFTTISLEGNPSCEGYQGGEIWFKADVPASGKLTIDTREVQINNADMSVYFGDCNGLVEYICDDDSGVGEMAKVTIQHVSAAGKTVYIQVWRNSSPYGGFFGISTHESGLLPVELIDFRATTQNHRVQLNWATASETDNAYFELEHSTDGVEFSTIGRVTGAGTTEKQQRYERMHDQPVPGINYYRLKDVDYSGKENYSSTVSASIDKPDRDVTVTPNPFDKELMLYFDEPVDYSALVQLTDIHGRVVVEYKLEEGTINHYMSINEHLEKGVYIITIKDDEYGIQKYAGKFLKN